MPAGVNGTPTAIALLLLSLWTAAGCGDSSASGGGGTGGAPLEGGAATGGDGGQGGVAPDPLGPWVFVPTEVAGLPAVWGGIVAEASPGVAYLAAGMKGQFGLPSTEVVRVEQKDGAVTTTSVSTGASSRYCGCSLLDTQRGELILLGGRDGDFNETPNAEIVDLESGAVTPLDDAGAADHPVGCHAIFLPDRDVGYVFGGAAQADGFTDAVFRYSPADHSFTAVDPTPSGPVGRYDGALRYPYEGGPIYLVGGMGQSNGLKFFSDVWTFDPDSEQWSAIAASGEVPPGRRTPWVAFAGDKSALVMGFGTDTAQGTHFLGDLWRFDLSTGAWSAIEHVGEVAPAPRGFALWLPGPVGSAGLLSGGIDPKVAKQAFVLAPPTADGGWR